jgi:hypothetical protein
VSNDNIVMDDELGRMRKEMAMADSLYYSRICLEVLRKLMINLSQNSWSLAKIQTEDLSNTKRVS